MYYLSPFEPPSILDGVSIFIVSRGFYGTKACILRDVLNLGIFCLFKYQVLVWTTIFPCTILACLVVNFCETVRQSKQILLIVFPSIEI